jgi:hypothetical protein
LHSQFLISCQDNYQICPPSIIHRCTPFFSHFFLSPRGGRSAQPKPVNIFENLDYRCRIFFRFLFNYSAFRNSYRGFGGDPSFILAKQSDLASETREGLKSNQTFFKNWGRPVATQLLNSQRFQQPYKDKDKERYSFES